MRKDFACCLWRPIFFLDVRFNLATNENQLSGPERRNAEFRQCVPYHNVNEAHPFFRFAIGTHEALIDRDGEPCHSFAGVGNLQHGVMREIADDGNAIVMCHSHISYCSG